MAIEYNNIYLKVEKPYTSKYMMVSIPLYMYRIETNEFEHGLNFFQKTVLKFKSKPGIKDDTIAEYIGLDSRLIAMVRAELQAKQLINEQGSLSGKGKEKLNEVDGLVVNSGKRKMGYLFKYVNEDKLYPYYIDKVEPADLLDNLQGKHPKVITGTKGDGEDYTENPFFLDETFKSKLNFNRPTEREVLQLIQNSNKKSSSKDEGELRNDKLLSQLSIRYLNDQPEIVWACTYVYLHRNEDDTYEPDWKIIDPFGYGDNVSLKFYINNPTNQILLDSINSRFADAKTLGGKILSEYEEQINKLIEEKLLSDFSIGLYNLDNNLQIYLKSIIKYLILLENHKYNDLDASVSFSLNMQNALENIFKQDREKRNDFYLQVFNNLEIDYIDNKGPKYNRDHVRNKIDNLTQIYQTRLFSSSTYVPGTLKSVCKGYLSRGSSLNSYLASFILTYSYDNKSILFKILRDRVEVVIEVAQLRNDKSHGQTINEKPLTPLSKEELQKYYNFIKSFINDYIQNY